MATNSWEERAHRIERRLLELAEITDEPGMLTRTFLSPAMKETNRRVKQWMEEAGLETQEDYATNLFGRQIAEERLPVLLIGSHLDTVRNAGRYDGALGVALGIEIADWVRNARPKFPFSLALVAFSDEEGVRFKTGFLGSSVFCGLLNDDYLKAVDAEGVALGALLSARSMEPSQLNRPSFPLNQLLAYFEVHLEQGPVLENRNCPVGAVTAIAGQVRAHCTWRGKASHAGTTPIDLRRDALVGAAAFIQEVDRLARQRPGLMATVGEIYNQPNVSNVVPASVTHSLDLRHQDDSERVAAARTLQERAAAIAAERQLSLEWTLLQDTDSTLCDPQLNTFLRTAVRKVTGELIELPSGAGHDGVMLSRLCPVAMLFVRCRDGLSHHPDEFVDLADIETALQTTAAFLDELSLGPIPSQ
jgi:allantoate deiminase